MKNNLSRLVPAILLSVSVFAGTTFAVGGAMEPAGEVNAETTFSLVTKSNPIEIGDNVVITNTDCKYAMSAKQGSNNRDAVAVTYETLASTSDIATFVVKEGTTGGSFSFYDEALKGYLYAASSEKNWLRTESTLSANSSWDFSATEAGVSTLTAKGSFTRNKMQYNSSNTLFSCYSSAQKDIAIYKKVVSTSNYEVVLQVGKGSYKDANQKTSFVGDLNGSSTFTLPSKEAVNGAYGVEAYTLLHWVDEAGATYEPGSTYTITGNQTLKAVYDYSPTISVSQVYNIIDGLASKEQTEEVLTVRGKFNGEYYNNNTNNPYIVDTVDGATKVILYDATSEDVLYVGCEVIITSQFMKYNSSTYESVPGATYTVVKQPRITLALEAGSISTLYVGAKALGGNASDTAIINATVENAEGYSINWVCDENVFDLGADNNQAVIVALVGGEEKTVTAQVMVAGAVKAEASMTFTTVAVKKLATPVITYDEVSNLLSWNAVEGAHKYKLKIEPEDTTVTPISQELDADVTSYTPNVAAGYYMVSLVALGNGVDILNSEEGIGDFTYQESATVAFAKSVSEIKTSALLGMSYTIEDKKDTMQYSGDTTLYPKDGDDIVANYDLGLNSSIYSITVHNGGTSNVPGINKDGSWRLYAGGTYAVVTSKNIISSITLSFTSATNSNVSVCHSVGATVAIEGEETEAGKTFEINSNSFVLKNNSSSQVRIKSMVMNYSANTYSDTRARFVVNVPAEVYNSAVLKDANAKWGVAIEINRKIIDVVMDASNIIAKEDGSYEYVASVTNIPEEAFKTMIKAVGYVEYTYNEKSVRNEMIAAEYSIETMVQTYLADAATMGLTTEQVEILKDFQNQCGLAA